MLTVTMLEIVLLFTAVPFLLLVSFVWLQARKFSHIPGDKGITIFGHIYYILNSIIHGTLDDLFRRVNVTLDKHGDVACFWLGPFLFTAVADPDIIQAVSHNAATVNKESLVFDNLNSLLIGGFTKSKSDEEWRYYRRLNTKFMRKEMLESYINTFGKRSKELVNAMMEQKGDFSIHPLTMLLTIDTVLETHFGLKFNELANKNWGDCHDVKQLESLISSMMSNPQYIIGGKLLFKLFFKKCTYIKNLENRYYHELKKKVTQLEGVSFIPQALEMLVSNNKNGVSLERTRCELRELLFVGVTTTCELLSCLLLLLAVHPEVQEKVWIEQEEIFHGSERLPTPEDLRKMIYLRMAIKEAARLLGGPLFPRRCTKKIKIGKFTFPENSTILLCSHRVRTSPKYWEKPMEFYPEHFLPEKVLSRPKGVDTSFGVLPRACSGSQYAMDFAKVVISSVVRNLNLSTSSSPDDLEFRPVILMTLKRPGLLSCQSRLKN